MLEIRVGGVAIDDATQITWSSVDPGGFEACGFSTTTPVSVGQEIYIRDGLSVCFHGVVEEPGLRVESGHTTYSVAGVGYNAFLSRNPYSMVYVERDLSQFQSMPLPREIALAESASGYVSNDNGDFQVKAGESVGLGGYPALVMAFTNLAVTTGRHPIVEPWYDAGFGNTLSLIRFSYETYDKNAGGLNFLSANFVNLAILMNNDAGSSFSGVSSDLGTNGTVTLPATSPLGRYVAFQFYYNALIPSTEVDCKFMVSDLRMFGNHSLQARGTAPNEGFYPSDIAVDALRRSRCGFDIVFNDANGYIVSQCVYRTKTPPSQIITDMTNYVGWHWGVWEPQSALGTRPTFHFVAPPRDATATVSYRNCENVDLTQKYSEMYNRAIVNYSLPNGTVGSRTVDKANPWLPSETIQTIVIDAGTVGSSDVAETIGTYQLALLQTVSRVSGSATLPGSLNGRPSHLLRPGRDKIRITSIPTGLSSLISEDSARLDTFRVRRISVSVDGKVPRSQIEFDHGADLIEVMQARLTNAQEASNLG